MRQGSPEAPGLVASIWRCRVIFVLGALTAGLTGYALSARQPPVYQTSARLVLDVVSPTAGLVDDGGRPPELSVVTQQVAERLRSAAVLARAVKLMGGGVTTQTIEQRLEPTPSPAAPVVVLTGTGRDPVETARLVNTVVQAHQEVAPRDRTGRADVVIGQLRNARDDVQGRLDQLGEDDAFDTERQALLDRLGTLDARLDELAAYKALAGSGVQQVDPAEVPSAPTQPKPLETALICAGLGALVAGAWAYWWVYWKAGQVKGTESVHEVQAALGAPLLGKIPRFPLTRDQFPNAGAQPGLHHLSQMDGISTEAYHLLAGALEFVLADKSMRVLLVTSAHPREGKSSTALNLALATVKDGTRVVLVDASLRQSDLSLLARRRRPGLTELVDGEAQLNECLVEIPVDSTVKPLLVPAGKIVADPAGFVRRQALRKSLMHIAERADVVLIDAPPLLEASDAASLARHADGILLVVSQGTGLAELRAVCERLAFVATPLIGFVSTSVPTPQRDRVSGLRRVHSSEASQQQNGTATTDQADHARMGERVERAQAIQTNRRT